METVNLKSRTDKLKEDINNLLVEYAKETDLIPDAVQAVLQGTKAQVPIKYNVDLGIQL